MRKIIFLCGLLVALSCSSLQAEEQREKQLEDVYQYLEVFADVLGLMEQHYVDELKVKAVIVGAINGMLTALDPHSSYLDEAAYKALRDETSGSFSGVGIVVTLREGILTIVSPIEGTPAARQGLAAGDKIVRIEGRVTKNMTLMEAVKALKGKTGSEVNLGIFRENWQEVRDFRLTRDEIPMKSVTMTRYGNGLVGVRMSAFQATTTYDCQLALQNALAETGGIRGLVLDLRGNPGGLLDEAIKVADLFLESGVIVSTKGRKNAEYYEAHPSTPVYTFPIVVLVNGGSASAAEIVAGALQDHGRAIILGTQTFGKGSVQTVIPMAKGTGLRLTTARYYTPNGTSIQSRGIRPDVILAFQLPVTGKEKGSIAPEVREKDLYRHLNNEQATKAVSQADSLAGQAVLSAVQQLVAEDNQLRTGLIILKSQLILSADAKTLTH